MNKRGRAKLTAVLGAFLAVFIITSVFVAASASDDLSLVSEYVGDFVQKKGISPESITNITEVSFDELPKEVNIENVGDTNLAIYQVDYEEEKEQKPEKIFVITYSVEKLRSQGDLIVSQDKREFLNFGFSGDMNKSGFLKTALDIESGPEKGYTMMRPGSITGISTNIEFIEGRGNFEIVIYKNGEKVNFGNSFIVENQGIENDYDIQSKGTVSFEAGDVISVYARASEGMKWKDITTLLEITTN